MIPRAPLVAALVLAAASCGNTAPPASAGGGGTTTSTGLGGADIFLDAGHADTGACDDAPSGAPDAATGCDGLTAGVSFATDVAPILAGCTGELCHLVPAVGTLVGIPSAECCDGRLRVAPGDAAHSYLIDKLTGHDLCSGGPMPLGGPMLPGADLLIVQRWICEGAPDN